MIRDGFPFKDPTAKLSESVDRLVNIIDKPLLNRLIGLYTQLNRDTIPIGILRLATRHGYDYAVIKETVKLNLTERGFHETVNKLEVDLIDHFTRLGVETSGKDTDEIAEQVIQMGGDDIAANYTGSITENAKRIALRLIEVKRGNFKSSLSLESKKKMDQNPIEDTFQSSGNALVANRLRKFKTKFNRRG